MEELLAKYALNDGELRSLKLNADYTSVNNSLVRQASVELVVRKRLAKNRLEPCLLQIRFASVQRVVINEDFSSHSYSDIVFKKLQNDAWYLSLDPYGNSGEPHAEDNLVIVADSVEIEEGVIQEVV